MQRRDVISVRSRYRRRCAVEKRRIEWEKRRARARAPHVIDPRKNARQARARAHYAHSARFRAVGQDRIFTGYPFSRGSTLDDFRIGFLDSVDSMESSTMADVI